MTQCPNGLTLGIKGKTSFSPLGFSLVCMYDLLSDPLLNKYKLSQLQLLASFMRSQTFVDVLQKAGAEARLLLYEGKTHTDIFLQVPYLECL
jgi:hypothetical protein